MVNNAKEKKVILITGSSSGLGAALAKALASDDYIPVITYRSHKKEAEAVSLQLSKQLGHEVICSYLDVNEQASLYDLHSEIMQKYGRLDTLVCNAGMDFHHTSFQDIQLQEWLDVFGAKVFGAFNSVSTMTSLLKASKNPNIIMISASLAVKPDPLDPVYSSACAALNNFGQSLVYSLAPEKIRSNIICPGPMDTGLSYWLEVKRGNPNIFNTFKDSNPMNILTNASHVADIIMSIEENRSLNGNIFYATGGSHLR